MIYAAWFILAITIAQMLEDWYRSKDIDVEEGAYWPSKMVCWGTCVAGTGRPEHNFRYFHFRVPFLRQWRSSFGPRGLSDGWYYLAIRKFGNEWTCYWIPG